MSQGRDEGSPHTHTRTHRGTWTSNRMPIGGHACRHTCPQWHMSVHMRSRIRHARPHTHTHRQMKATRSRVRRGPSTYTHTHTSIHRPHLCTDTHSGRRMFTHAQCHAFTHTFTHAVCVCVCAEACATTVANDCAHARSLTHVHARTHADTLIWAPESRLLCSKCEGRLLVAGAHKHTKTHTLTDTKTDMHTHTHTGLQRVQYASLL